MSITVLKGTQPTVRDFLNLLLSELDKAYPGAIDCMVVIGSGRERNAEDRFKQYGTASNELSPEREWWLLEMGRACVLQHGYAKEH